MNATMPVNADHHSGASGFYPQPISTGQSASFQAKAKASEAPVPSGARPPAGQAQQPLQRPMFQGSMGHADAVMGGPGSATAQKKVAVSQSGGGVTTDTGKRKGAVGKPTAKKAAKKAVSAQAKKGSTTFQFDVFGSKL